MKLILELNLKDITMHVTTPTGQNNNLQPSLNSEENDDCSICLASLKGKEVKIAICNHSFHKTCLDDWLKEKENCPLCRTDLKERDLQPNPAPRRFTPENQSLQENGALNQPLDRNISSMVHELGNPQDAGRILRNLSQQEHEELMRPLVRGITAIQLGHSAPREEDAGRILRNLSQQENEALRRPLVRGITAFLHRDVIPRPEDVGRFLSHPRQQENEALNPIQ